MHATLAEALAALRRNEAELRRRGVKHAAQDRVLQRLKEELVRLYGDRLERVILYGSRARGDAQPDSDYDIAVVLKDYDGDFQEVYRLADLEYDLLLETGAAVSAYPFAPSDLEKRTLFMHNLRTEGVPL